jgi:cytochrome c oxidase cbb3-type subunit 2
VPNHESAADLRLRIARIVKFRMPGTNMPGHEYLPDEQIEALTNYVTALRLKSETGLPDHESGTRH